MIPEGRNSGLVVSFRQKYPCWTLQKIASEVGVSRERVRQILSKHGMATKAAQQRFHCRYCNIALAVTNAFGSRTSTGVCRKCYKEYEFYTTLECDECHRLFSRRTALVLIELGKRNYQHVWCGHRCQGKWVGREYGTGVNGASEKLRLSSKQIVEKYVDFIIAYNNEKKINTWNYSQELSKKLGEKRSTTSQRISMLKKKGIIL